MHQHCRSLEVAYALVAERNSVVYEVYCHHWQHRIFCSKRVYELVIPSVATLIGAALYLTFPDIFKPGFLRNFSASVFQVMVFVVPFHLAALAAISTISVRRVKTQTPRFRGSNKTLEQYGQWLLFHQVNR